MKQISPSHGYCTDIVSTQQLLSGQMSAQYVLCGHMSVQYALSGQFCWFPSSSWS